MLSASNVSAKMQTMKEQTIGLILSIAILIVASVRIAQLESRNDHLTEINNTQNKALIRQTQEILTKDSLINVLTK